MFDPLKIAAVKGIIAEQDEDEGIWFAAIPEREKYLQEALRALTEAVEAMLESELY